jgi:hypothetical protein
MEISSLCASHHSIDFRGLIVLLENERGALLVSLAAKELTEALLVSDQNTD